jgi:glycosyltransferase involved in cell wall biosynthesis
MKIAICIPTYNQGSYLEKAIRSAYNQSIKPFEIIVSNDCSTDNTAAVLNHLSQEISILKVIHQPANIGIVANVNACLKAAVSDFIIRLDSDDILLPDYTEKMINLMLQFPDSGYGHCAIQEIDKNGGFLNQRFLRRKKVFLDADEALNAAIRGYKVAANILMFRRQALEKVNFINASTNFAEDFYLASQISASGYGNVYNREILAYYRVWTDAKMVRQKRKLSEIIGLRKVFEEVLEPAFKERKWNLKQLNKQKSKFAYNQSDALSTKIYSDIEKKELKIELLNLSNSRITRLFIWLNLNGFGSIVKFFSMLFQNFKKLLKKIAFK